MRKNLGFVDRGVRATLALAICALAGLGLIGGVLEIVLFFLAAVLAFTAFLRFCPLYALFRIRTCRVNHYL